MLLKEVVEAAPRALGVTTKALVGPGRSKSVARARAVAMYVARMECDASYPELGQAFERDSTTAMAAVRKVEHALLISDPVYKDLVLRLRSQLGL